MAEPRVLCRLAVVPVPRAVVVALLPLLLLLEPAVAVEAVPQVVELLVLQSHHRWPDLQAAVVVLAKPATRMTAPVVPR